MGRKVLGIAVAMLFIVSGIWDADAHWFDDDWNAVDHDTNNPLDHFCPTTGGDPDSSNTDKSYKGGHGHISEVDTQGNPVQWGYWDKEGYAAVSGNSSNNCDSAPSLPDPPPSNNNNRGNTGSGSSGSSTIADTLDEVREQSPDEHLHPHPVPSTPTCDPDIFSESFICYNWDITEDYQLIGFPILPIWGETIRELHTLLQRRLRIKNFLSQVYVNERWVSYTGFGPDEKNPEVGDMLITPHLGLMVDLEEPVGWYGYPQQGEIIDLEPGIHLIGLPEVPQNYQRASDLVSVDGVKWVRIGYERSVFIHSEDAPDDQELVKGQAIRIYVIKNVTLDLRGSIPETTAAPSIRRKGTLATSWGAMKR